MFFYLFRNLCQIPKMEFLDYCCCPPLSEKTVEINWYYWVFRTLSVHQWKSNDWRVMTVEISLNFALDIIRLDIFIILDKNKLIPYQSSMRKKMILFLERFYWNNFLQTQVIILKLFYLLLFVFHPKNSTAIEIKRNCYFRHSELSM